MLNQDLIDLLGHFKKCDVRFLVVGGHAVMKYTEPRFTKDLDLWVATDPKNAAAVYQALVDFGAPLENSSPLDFQSSSSFYQLGHPPLRVDIMMSIPGVEFESCWTRRVVTQVEGGELPFISRDDLILAKLAAGRPQDMLDVEKLRKS